jgi:hypothetical protein
MVTSLWLQTPKKDRSICCRRPHKRSRRAKVNIQEFRPKYVKSYITWTQIYSPNLNIPRLECCKFKINRSPSRNCTLALNVDWNQSLTSQRASWAAGTTLLPRWCWGRKHNSAWCAKACVWGRVILEFSVRRDDKVARWTFCSNVAWVTGVDQRLIEKRDKCEIWGAVYGGVLPFCLTSPSSQAF